MNGREIENLLRMIDENVAMNNRIVRGEIFRYLEDHQDDAVKQLRATQQVSIPTSLGQMTLSVQDLRDAVAA